MEIIMEKIKLMVNGTPGNMGVNVSEHVLQDPRFELVPYSLTGPEIDFDTFDIKGQSIHLLHPDKRENAITDIINSEGPFISVDYTHPTAVNANAAFYCQHQLPFVMGTTGGDREILIKDVSEAKLPAVIAPNMAKQIVGLQAMMAHGASNFPGLFKGYTMEVKESHQHGKADTSGTAKAMVQYFNDMGIEFTAQEIHQERDPNTQTDGWGIPEEYLSGHAWHTYTLKSDDGTVLFSFTHNVNGREVYVKGSLDAALFLQKKISAGEPGKVYSMIEVLKGEA
jgi:4-hydroxy-tetrahydrodipicolinate reductase